MILEVLLPNPAIYAIALAGLFNISPLPIYGLIGLLPMGEARN